MEDSVKNKIEHTTQTDTDSRGCDHDHEQEHEDTCGCGHDHHHEDEDTCGCGHDHHHEHEDACGCGHDHHHEDEDACGCGHDHHHEHAHEPGTIHHHTPGHPDDCQCELCHPHEEYCDVCGESLANCTCHMPDDGVEKRVYILENLDCANCAAKMEDKIRELAGVKYCTVTYATKQLRLSADNQDELLPEIEKICTSIESEVKVVRRGGRRPGATKNKTYILENLDCANCAAKMEQQISKLNGIEGCSITYATKQLRVIAKDPDRYLDEIRRICTSIESEVKVAEKDTSPKSEDTLPLETPRTSSKEPVSRERIEFAAIIAGAVLFVVGEALIQLGYIEERSIPVIAICLVAYVILGGEIVVKAVKNISKGQIFDENFLMCIATIGALVIGEYPEAVGVMLFYRIGEMFEHKAVDRSRGQIMDAVDMRPEVVNLLIGETVKVIPAQEAQVGDILMIRPGDRIPLDGVIIDGESRLDTSPITGEPVPVAVGYGDEVTSGCVNTSGELKIRVEKMLEDSMVTRILDSVENAAASKPRIDRFITRFARIYTPVVVFLALAVAIIPSLFTGNWYHWVYTALTFLVMSCPCALVLSVPLAFFSGIGAGSRKGILFKGGVSIEALSGLSAVIMDKTGTVTEGNFQVQQIVATGPYSEDELLRMCASCEIVSTHPIASSIVNEAKERQLTLIRPDSLEELAGHGIAGELEEGRLLCGNRELMEEYGVRLHDLPEKSYGSEVLIAVDGELAGYMVISDTIKEDAKDSISRLNKMGLHTVMMTGDSLESADAVAKQTGIEEVHAKLMPQDKFNILNEVRNANGSVMFVGDGINDAPVLAGADVGAAMGSGADAAIEAADAVFMNSSVESIPESINIARITNRIAVQNVVFALIVKIAVMAIGLMGYANMWLAVFADTGVAVLCVLNSIRALYIK